MTILWLCVIALLIVLALNYDETYDIFGRRK